jgi:hypothetical protein
MLNIHDLIRLSAGKIADPLHRTIVFDGKVAVSMSHAMGSRPWWAGVPFTQADVTEPVAVPVDTIKAHLLKSRHLFVKRDHVHNNQGLRHPWPIKPDWNDVLCKLPPRPQGDCVQFELDLNCLDRVLVVVDPTDIRTAVTGVFFDFETGRLAGTDGHRVHMYKRAVPKLARKKGQSSLQMIVPKDPAYWLLRSEDKAAKVTVWQLGAGQSLVLMQTSEALVYTMALDAKFPNIARVMPSRTRFSSYIKLDPIAFSDGVEAMAKRGEGKPDAPMVPAVSVHWGEGRIYAGSGPEFVAFPHELHNFGSDRDAVTKTIYSRFRSRYLQDVADCVTPNAIWGVPFAGLFGGGPIGDMDRALAVFDEDFSAVVMPISWDNLPPPSDKPKTPEKPPEVAAKPSSPAVVPIQPAKPATGLEKSTQAPKSGAKVVPLVVKAASPVLTAEPKAKKA